VFWTRNPSRFRPALERVRDMGLPFVVQFTILDYPRSLETSTPEVGRAIEAARELAQRFGPKIVVWRYDPIVVTDRTPAAWHRESFARSAAALTGATDEVVVSFATIYRKTQRNLGAAARRHGFAWRDPPLIEKRGLLADIAEEARRHALRPTLCSQPELSIDGIEPARCVDAERIGVAAKLKGNRPGCACHESRDIGAYDTCPHGCVYCYAVNSPALARRRHRAHDPDDPSLASSLQG
jgi:DNA repair photolyase